MLNLQLVVDLTVFDCINRARILSNAMSKHCSVVLPADFERECPCRDLCKACGARECALPLISLMMLRGRDLWGQNVIGNGCFYIMFEACFDN